MFSLRKVNNTMIKPVHSATLFTKTDTDTDTGAATDEGCRKVAT
jgi:hypothetical protein